MNLADVKKIYFLGIGGIGMSALARYFMLQGKQVAGYDRTITPLTRQLEAEGAMINYEDSVKHIPSGIDLVIFTPAIPSDSRQLEYIRQNELPLYKRARILGMISEGKKVIAVAGTHGKTTVTTILAHIFKRSGADFMAFLGGISTNYNTNFIHSGEPRWVIAEADEYDRSFLQLHPDIAIVTSMDADHLDVYGSVTHLEDSFRLFVGNLKQDGILVRHAHLTRLKENVSQVSYALNEVADFSAEDIRVSEGKYSCTFNLKGQKIPVSFGWAGRHNLENALAATTASVSAGIAPEIIKKALIGFKGVKRRFEVIVQNPKVTYIDDYAHHPEEIRTCLTSAKEMFPGKKLTGIFQPHLFSRTRDFAAEFGKALSILDEVVLMDIYPARELPITGITSKIIFDNIEHENKTLVSDDKLLDFVKKNKFEVLITLGAGDIDKYIEPIKEILKA